MVSCADYLLDGTFERTIGYDITTAWPINIHEVSEEDYPNYKDIIDAQLREKVSLYLSISSFFGFVVHHCEPLFKVFKTIYRFHALYANDIDIFSYIFVRLFPTYTPVYLFVKN